MSPNIPKRTSIVNTSSQSSDTDTEEGVLKLVMNDLVNVLLLNGPKYESKEDVKALLLSKRVEVTDKKVAELLIYMSSTYGSATTSPDYCDSRLIPRFSSIPWSYKEIVVALKDSKAALNWMEIYSSFDNDSFLILTMDSFYVIIDSWMFINGYNTFPYHFFLNRVWKNRQAQSNFLLFLIDSDSSRTCVYVNVWMTRIATSEDVRRGRSFDLDVDVERLNSFKTHESTFNCIELFRCLVLNMNFSLIEKIAQSSPEWCLLGLSFIDSRHQLSVLDIIKRLYDDVLRWSISCIPVIHLLFSNEPFSTVERIADVVLKRFYSQGGVLSINLLSKVLDIVLECKMLPFISEVQVCPDFCFEVVMLASRRDHLNLRLWLKNMHKKNGDVFVKSFVKYLEKKFKSNCESKITQENIDNINEENNNFNKNVISSSNSLNNNNFLNVSGSRTSENTTSDKNNNILGSRIAENIGNKNITTSGKNNNILSSRIAETIDNKNITSANNISNLSVSRITENIDNKNITSANNISNLSVSRVTENINNKNITGSNNVKNILGSRVTENTSNIASNISVSKVTGNNTGSLSKTRISKVNVGISSRIFPITVDMILSTTQTFDSVQNMFQKETILAYESMKRYLPDEAKVLCVSQPTVEAHAVKFLNAVGGNEICVGEAIECIRRWLYTSKEIKNTNENSTNKNIRNKNTNSDDQCNFVCVRNIGNNVLNTISNDVIGWNIEYRRELSHRILSQIAFHVQHYSKLAQSENMAIFIGKLIENDFFTEYLLDIVLKRIVGMLKKNKNPGFLFSLKIIESCYDYLNINKKKIIAEIELFSGLKGAVRNQGFSDYNYNASKSLINQNDSNGNVYHSDLNIVNQEQSKNISKKSQNQSISLLKNSNFYDLNTNKHFFSNNVYNQNLNDNKSDRNKYLQGNNESDMKSNKSDRNKYLQGTNDLEIKSNKFDNKHIMSFKNKNNHDDPSSNKKNSEKIEYDQCNIKELVDELFVWEEDPTTQSKKSVISPTSTKENYEIEKLIDHLRYDNLEKTVSGLVFLNNYQHIARMILEKKILAVSNLHLKLIILLGRKFISYFISRSFLLLENLLIYNISPTMEYTLSCNLGVLLGKLTLSRNTIASLDVFDINKFIENCVIRKRYGLAINFSVNFLRQGKDGIIFVPKNVYLIKYLNKIREVGEKYGKFTDQIEALFYEFGVEMTKIEQETTAYIGKYELKALDKHNKESVVSNKLKIEIAGNEDFQDEASIRKHVVCLAIDFSVREISNAIIERTIEIATNSALELYKPVMLSKIDAKSNRKTKTGNFNTDFSTIKGVEKDDNQSNEKKFDCSSKNYRSNDNDYINDFSYDDKEFNVNNSSYKNNDAGDNRYPRNKDLSYNFNDNDKEFNLNNTKYKNNDVGDNRYPRNKDLSYNFNDNSVNYTTNEDSSSCKKEIYNLIQNFVQSLIRVSSHDPLRTSMSENIAFFTKTAGNDLESEKIYEITHDNIKIAIGIIERAGMSRVDEIFNDLYNNYLQRFSKTKKYDNEMINEYHINIIQRSMTFTPIVLQPILVTEVNSTKNMLLQLSKRIPNKKLTVINHEWTSLLENIENWINRKNDVKFDSGLDYDKTGKCYRSEKNNENAHDYKKNNINDLDEYDMQHGLMKNNNMSKQASDNTDFSYYQNDGRIDSTITNQNLDSIKESQHNKNHNTGFSYYQKDGRIISTITNQDLNSIKELQHNKNQIGTYNNNNKETYDINESYCQGNRNINYYSNVDKDSKKQTEGKNFNDNTKNQHNMSNIYRKDMNNNYLNNIADSNLTRNNHYDIDNLNISCKMKELNYKDKLSYTNKTKEFNNNMNTNNITINDLNPNNPILSGNQNFVIYNNYNTNIKDINSYYYNSNDQSQSVIYSNVNNTNGKNSNQNDQNPYKSDSDDKTPIEMFNILLSKIIQSDDKDSLCENLCQCIIGYILKHNKYRELMLYFLNKIFYISFKTAREVISWFIYGQDERKLNIDLVNGFIKYKLININEYDQYLARTIKKGLSIKENNPYNSKALKFTLQILSNLTLNEIKPCTPYDFIFTIECLSKANEEKHDEKIHEILNNISSLLMPVEYFYDVKGEKIGSIDGINMLEEKMIKNNHNEKENSLNIGLFNKETVLMCLGSIHLTWDTYIRFHKIPTFFCFKHLTNLIELIQNMDEAETCLKIFSFFYFEGIERRNYLYGKMFLFFIIELTNKFATKKNCEKNEYFIMIFNFLSVMSPKKIPSFVTHLFEIFNNKNIINELNDTAYHIIKDIIFLSNKNDKLISPLTTILLKIMTKNKVFFRKYAFYFSILTKNSLVFLKNLFNGNKEISEQICIPLKFKTYRETYLSMTNYLKGDVNPKIVLKIAELEKNEKVWVVYTLIDCLTNYHCKKSSDNNKKCTENGIDANTYYDQSKTMNKEENNDYNSSLYQVGVNTEDSKKNIVKNQNNANTVVLNVYEDSRKNAKKNQNSANIVGVNVYEDNRKNALRNQNSANTVVVNVEDSKRNLLKNQINTNIGNMNNADTKKDLSKNQINVNLSNMSIIGGKKDLNKNKVNVNLGNMNNLDTRKDLSKNQTTLNGTNIDDGKKNLLKTDNKNIDNSAQLNKKVEKIFTGRGIDIKDYDPEENYRIYDNQGNYSQNTFKDSKNSSNSGNSSVSDSETKNSNEIISPGIEMAIKVGLNSTFILKNMLSQNIMENEIKQILFSRIANKSHVPDMIVDLVDQIVNGTINV